MRITARLIIGVLSIFCTSLPAATAQSESNQNLALKVQQLTDAMNATQKELERSQHELEQLRTQLTSLQQQIAGFRAVESESAPAAQLSAAVEQIREQQSIQETQIATHEQAKVESESKYPLKLSGLVLLNGFVNTTNVDDPVAPTLVIGGNGSTGASLRQTTVGFDARGPRLFSAESRADLRTDFYGGGSTSGGAYGDYASGLLRLRTAHASLDWKYTQAFFALDHTLLAPNTPTSLVSVAVPALGWSGNLWTWNPQFGITKDVPLPGPSRFRMQAAVIDVLNPPQIYAAAAPANARTPRASTSESSRWPGAEARLAILNRDDPTGLQIGAGGAFRSAPHPGRHSLQLLGWHSRLSNSASRARRSQW